MLREKVHVVKGTPLGGGAGSSFKEVYTSHPKLVVGN